MKDRRKAGLDGVNRINVIGKAVGEFLTELTGFQQEDMKLMRDMRKAGLDGLKAIERMGRRVDGWLTGEVGGQRLAPAHLKDGGVL